MGKLSDSVLETPLIMHFLSLPSPETGATGGRKQPNAPPKEQTVTLVTMY